MKHFALVALIIGSTSTLKITDVKLPEYRSEFYGDTWRYTGHPRIADEDQWVADAPQAYVAAQLRELRSGINDINYDEHHDETADSMEAKQKKYETARLDNIEREDGRKKKGSVYPHPPELKTE